MCRALKVLCADAGPERLAALRRAAVSVHWEVIGGARSPDELRLQVAQWEPDIVVVGDGLGSEVISMVRELLPQSRVVAVGPLSGADAVALSLDGVRDAILSVPRPAGPVRR